MSIEEWLNSRDFWKYNNNWLGNRLKIIKNEKMVENLKEEMYGVSKWLGIKFTSSLLKRTLSNGDTPFVDSSYLKKSSNLDKNYFSPENVKKRWLSELSDGREILMIETLFKDLMNKFEYQTIHKMSLIQRIKGVCYFLLPHRGPNRLMYYKPGKDELDRFRIRLAKINKNKKVFFFSLMPKNIKAQVIWISSFFNHFKIYFFPGNRWERYDNPSLEGTYRNY